ncbi:hypothetical protein PFISCL1PPCAC_2661 [Pristionchus fissidentatus]|uniref:Fungal lipase-type domain-containing protein n=1 Tax=Pristionchus fissidentatus TaxID=1538716 RepID=A0AAV5V054_9BILA|nr:hypothetical protein PFISCL1PPCAC_2661 [Pristionchus fissidentatus]
MMERGHVTMISLLYLLASTAAIEFDDSLARNTIYPLAAAAYGDSSLQQQCLDKHLPGAKLSHHAEVPCDSIKDDTCSGFTYVDETRKAIGLGFRGTNADEQLALEIYSTLQDALVAFKDGGKVAPYFNTAFEDIWNEGGLGADLQRLSDAHPDYTLYITGHSLGGALAAMGAIRVAKNKIHPVENIVFYTFGEPRTGDQQFANLLDSLVQGYRVVHNKDLIPHTPFTSMGYMHHRSEVFYENNMSPGSSYVVCQGQEDPTCSNKFTFGLVFDPDHFHYYGIHVERYGRSGCTTDQ